MKSKIQQRTNMLLYIFAIFGLTAVGYVGVSAIFGTGIKIVDAQQDPSLSQRLNQIEQRFTSIESRINQGFPIKSSLLSVLQSDGQNHRQNSLIELFCFDILFSPK
jgi:hypothetical protein